MITISNLAMQFGGSVLFKQVDLQFTPGNCYGVIGANGAGKSTFLKLLSGELEPTSGEIFIKPGARMSVLKQDQNQYDAYTILDTVIMGNQHLYDVMKEKDALYEKPDFSEEDGMRASELEAEFADMDGWEAESDASKLLQGLGIPVELHYDLMANTDPRLKVKVLLAQALFGKPDIVMLDEPTNNLDIEAINWLEDFILDYEDTGLVIVVSHDRHFLNTVCTHIVDIDYGKIKMYVGNYDFWYESSQLIQQLIRNKNKRAEEKIAELQTFIARFAANKAGYTEFDELLNGTTSMASTTDDPIAPARVVCEFAKKNKNVVKIKGGMVEGKVLSVEELMSFGELPSKNALVAQVLGTFLAPISSLAVVLNQILEQKGGAPAEEAPAEA